MEENALSPGPRFTVIVMVQTTWELLVITVSNPTLFYYSWYVKVYKLERSFVRGHIVLKGVACPEMI